MPLALEWLARVSMISHLTICKRKKRFLVLNCLLGLLQPGHQTFWNNHRGWPHVPVFSQIVAPAWMNSHIVFIEISRLIASKSAVKTSWEGSTAAWIILSYPQSCYSNASVYCTVFILIVAPGHGHYKFVVLAGASDQQNMVNWLETTFCFFVSVIFVILCFRQFVKWWLAHHHWLPDLCFSGKIGYTP